MWRTASFLLFVCLFCALGASNALNDACSPCFCVDTVDGLVLMCQGSQVVAYPTLNEAVKNQLVQINVVETYISCLPMIQDNEYPLLKYFNEEGNVFWNCDCFRAWEVMLKETIFRSTSCQTSETTASPQKETTRHNDNMTTESVNSPPPLNNLSSTDSFFNSTDLNENITEEVPNSNVATYIEVIIVTVVSLAILLPAALVSFRRRRELICRGPPLRRRRRRNRCERSAGNRIYRDTTFSFAEGDFELDNISNSSVIDTGAHAAESTLAQNSHCSAPRIETSTGCSRENQTVETGSDSLADN